MIKITISALALAFVSCIPAVFADEPRERSEISDEYKWDLSTMYATAEAWELDVKRFEARLGGIAGYRGRLDSGGDVLLAAIKEIEAVNSLVSDLYVYAGLKSGEDTRISENSARFSRAQALYSRYEEETAFFRPELLAIPGGKLQRMINETPGLHRYRHYIDEELRLRDYTLSESEEAILAAAGEPLGKFGEIYGAFNDADITFGDIVDESGTPVELTRARYGALMNSTNRTVREDAWKTLFAEYASMGNFLASLYDGHIRARVFEAKIRGFESARQSATYRSAIPRDVYTNMVKVAREGSVPLQRYLALRRKNLGLDVLEVWDMYAPIIEPTIKDVSWPEAQQLVADALAPLGRDYVDVYWLGFTDGWVDVFESRGKRGGAYSWGTYTSRPYLSMNYTGNLDSVSVLAHEYGHSIHSYLTRGTQPYVYGFNRTFIAEIASMTNEALLFQKLLRESTNRDEKIFLLQTYLDRFRGSFYRQASFADFEMQAHAAVEAGGALTRDSLNRLYRDVFIAYHGDSVRADPLVDSEWSRIPHFFRNDTFYVYQYATSFAAATALAKMLLDEGEPARVRYLEMLKSGSSDYPINLLKKAGIDMTTPAPIRDTIAVFEAYVDELEATLASPDS